MKGVQERDKMKRWICKGTGITLVIIPYWWDKKIESLAATIRVARPDIPFPSALLSGLPISTLSPQRIQKGRNQNMMMRVVKNYTKEMETASRDVDVKGWYCDYLLIGLHFLRDQLLH